MDIKLQSQLQRRSSFKDIKSDFRFTLIFEPRYLSTIKLRTLTYIHITVHRIIFMHACHCISCMLFEKLADITYINGPRSRWRNGLARLHQWSRYLQGPGFESHLQPVDFFTCNKVSRLNNRAPNANICATCLNNLLETRKKTPKRKYSPSKQS